MNPRSGESFCTYCIWFTVYNPGTLFLHYYSPLSALLSPLGLHASFLHLLLQVATVSERSRIMELEREVADLQLRLRASQQKEDAASLSQQQISSLKAQAQSQEKKVCGKHQRSPSVGVFVQLGLGSSYMIPSAYYHIIYGMM